MSLERILQTLDAEAERQLATIAEETQARVESIRRQAQAEAEAICRKHREAIQAPLKAEQARILNRARQEALKLVLDAREAALTQALEAAGQRLALLPTTEGYSVLLRRLVEEAIQMMGRERELYLRVQSQDVELVRSIVQEIGQQALVEGGLEHDDKRGSPWACLGGVTVMTCPDRQIKLINTLAARLERVSQLYRSQIAEMILDHGQEG